MGPRDVCFTEMFGVLVIVMGRCGSTVEFYTKINFYRGILEAQGSQNWLWQGFFEKLLGRGGEIDISVYKEGRRAL